MGHQKYKAKISRRFPQPLQTG
uniref:Uncharacterized protein n=1 Tax=Anguilla anguilla TaxID=7936 RepID=A0A0E9UEC4_ANGAN